MRTDFFRRKKKGLVNVHAIAFPKKLFYGGNHIANRLDRYVISNADLKPTLPVAALVFLCNFKSHELIFLP